MDVNAAIRALEADLRAVASPQRAINEKRYLKSDLDFFGASVPAIRRAVVASSKENKALSRAELRALVDGLWSQPVHEHHMAAIELLDLYSRLLLSEDLALIERMLRTSGTWAYVDSLAATVAGGLVERFPDLNSTLDRWAEDGDFWLRRSAMLALLVPLRRGEGDWPRFARYADSMLDEKEFFIRKAIGWVLRDTSKKRPELVFGHVMSPRRKGARPRAALMSGLTFREATRQLPPVLRARAIASREGARKA